MKLKDGKLKIAFIHEEVSHLTGGRYYSWFMMCALAEMGHDVTVYTNRRPTFIQDFYLYKKPRIVMASLNAYRLRTLDIRADVYFGSPLSGAICASRMGKKYNKPSFALVFDPFPAMKKYLGNTGFKGWEELLFCLKNNNTKIISLSNSIGSYIPDWIGRKKEDVIPVFPCINSRVLDKTNGVDRGDYVIFLSRIVRHKRFEDVLYACQAANVKLKVVSSVSGVSTQKLVDTFKMKDKVEFYWKVNDKEKFELIKGSVAVISGSIMEGWGMFVSEAIATGTPFVGYDFPTFVEQKDYANVDNFYLARPKHALDLSRKLKRAIKEEKFLERNKSFDFEKMVEALGGFDV